MPASFVALVLALVSVAPPAGTIDPMAEPRPRGPSLRLSALRASSGRSRYSGRDGGARARRPRRSDPRARLEATCVTIRGSVFEIGNSLRGPASPGVRVAPGGGDTKIRAKYLRALEEEHFEVLPGETYVKGFLRTYAEYLGLDGSSTSTSTTPASPGEEEFPLSRRRPRRPRPRRRWSRTSSSSRSRTVAVTILVVVAWKFGTSGETANLIPVADLAGTTAPTTTSSSGRRPHPPASPSQSSRSSRSRPPGATAGCASERAPPLESLYQGTLEQGQSQRLPSGSGSSWSLARLLSSTRS